MALKGSWRASKLMGLNVYNEANEKLGDINELLVDKSGKIEAVVIGVGGFLGMGEHDIAVSMDKLKFVEEPVRTSSSSSSTTARRRPPARASTNTTHRNTNDWVPDHAVMNGNKEQLKALPQFKYSDYNWASKRSRNRAPRAFFAHPQPTGNPKNGPSGFAGRGPLSVNSLSACQPGNAHDQYGRALLQTCSERLRQAQPTPGVYYCSVQTFVVFTADSASGLGLVHAVSHDGGGRGRRLGVDDGALLGGRVADDVELCGAGCLCAEGESARERRITDQLLHDVLLQWR